MNAILTIAILFAGVMAWRLILYIRDLHSQIETLRALWHSSSKAFAVLQQKHIEEYLEMENKYKRRKK